jgi:allophanate hydrolase
MNDPVWISRVEGERPRGNGPLDGLRFAVKDNIDVSTMLTTAGCPAFAYSAERSAPVVERAEQAGATLIGKTNLDQFATGLVGVRSPYGACASVFHPEYVSGGSSSGSAVAVARGEVDFAFGTDTAGSGRVPAAFNGILGLKPTRGVLSCEGVVPACKSLDCVSIFAPSIEIARRVFRACGSFQLAQREMFLERVRFGYLAPDQREFFGDGEAAMLYEQAIARLEAAGAVGSAFDYEPFRQAARLLYSGPWVAERYAAVGEFIASQPAEAVDPTVRKIILGGASHSAVDAFRAMYRLDELKLAAQAAWDAVDLLLLPTTGTIYRIAEVQADPVALNTNLGYYTNFVNLMDLCALAIPAGLRPATGLPFGVSLIARAHADEALLDLAGRFMDTVEVAVVGAHLRGMPLHGQMEEAGARLIWEGTTAADYRLFDLPDSTPPKPGLRRSPGFAGKGIEVEVYAMSAAAFGRFVARIPPPMGIGSVTLSNGRAVKGFLCEAHALEGALEITEWGGWRAWRREAARRS